jgi:hypothetical protein
MSAPNANRFLWTALLIGTAFSFLVCYWIATQAIVIGSREGNWIFPYIRPFDARTFAIVLIASASAAWLVVIQDNAARRHVWPTVIGWTLGAIVFQGILRSLTPYSFEHIFTSDSANAFYGVARHYTAETVLTDFDRARAAWPLHAQANMPGKLMLVYALKYISKRPDILPWLVVMLSNAGGPLMYLFARDLFEDRRTALYSTVLYLFVPAKLFFFPLLNVVTPVFILACAVLMLRWVSTGNLVYPALLGVALYLVVFFEPLPLVMGLLFASIAVRSLRRGDISPGRLGLQIAVVVTVFIATHMFVAIRMHFNLLEAFRQIAAHAAAFNVEARRPYAVWARENLTEFLFGIGICQAVLFGAALLHGIGSAGVSASRIDRPIVTLCLGLAAVLLITDLIGVNRGEVIRLWIFLACFFQMPAAYVCAQLDRRAAIGIVLGTTLLQAGLGTSMIGFIVP